MRFISKVESFFMHLRFNLRFQPLLFDSPPIIIVRLESSFYLILYNLETAVWYFFNHLRTLPLDNKPYLAIYTELFCAWMFQYFFKSSQIPKILKFLAFSNSQCVQYNSCLQFLRWFFKPILVSCALSLCKRKEECKQIGQG